LEIYKSDKTIRTGEIFDILDGMFSNVDAYCSDPNLITDPKYDIDEAELRKRAGRTLAELSAITTSNTSNNTTAHTYDWDFNFRLTDECRFIDIKAPLGIELKVYPNDKGTKSLREFTVKVKAFTEEEALKKARIQAKTLTDILAVKSAKHLGQYITGFSRLSDPSRSGQEGRGKVVKELVIKYNIDPPEPLDLSQGRVVQLIKTLEPHGRDQRLVERLNHANNALEAEKAELHEVMIKEYYLAVADKIQARKYEPLRDVLSHHEQLKPDTIKKLENNFGQGYFVLTRNQRFDHSSPTNIERLRKEAYELRSIALSYINQELT
jgi:hypothetical protein